MKSCHFCNFDILKIINDIWTVTLHFVFWSTTDTSRAIIYTTETREQLQFIKMWTLFSKTNIPVFAWKIFLENAIKIISIIPSNRASEAQTCQQHLASSYSSQWKHLVFISERVSCIHVWWTPFSVVPVNRTTPQKWKLNRRQFSVQKDPDALLCLSVRKSVVTFHWCSVYNNNKDFISRG